MSRSAPVRMIRRAALALSLAGIATAAIRLRGHGEVPPQGRGGWRELSGPDFR
ncbi:MAG TPA: hypothetical protein VHG90_09405 [Acidimicrobiales bacterium]|nr:hypothetical protein [Acidimicrobiales bacterium]